MDVVDRLLGDAGLLRHRGDQVLRERAFGEAQHWLEAGGRQGEMPKLVASNRRFPPMGADTRRSNSGLALDEVDFATSRCTAHRPLRSPSNGELIRMRSKLAVTLTCGLLEAAP